MVEYLFYVTMVFIPIAIGIVYLLRQEAFPSKTIFAVIMLSFLVIVSFPFSMQHLGATTTAFMYCVALAVLAILLFKPAAYAWEHDEPAGNHLFSELTGEHGQYISGVLNGPVPADPIHQLAAVSESTETCCPERPATPEAFRPLNDREAKESKPAEPVHRLPEPDGESPCHAKADRFPKETRASDAPEKDLATADQVIMAEEMQNHDAFAQAWPENDRDAAGADVVPAAVSAEERAVDAAEDGPAKHQAARNDIQAAFPLSIIEDDGTVADQDELALEPAGEEISIIDLIEQGFRAKVSGDMETAAEKFYEAFDCADRELQYLLGMELVTIHQNRGEYVKADVILDQLLAVMEGQAEAVAEIRKQKQYINLLTDELNRLGLPFTPAPEIPRFIRMKINEEMLA